jgi:hypothetical protein
LFSQAGQRVDDLLRGLVDPEAAHGGLDLFHLSLEAGEHLVCPVL